MSQSYVNFFTKALPASGQAIKISSVGSSFMVSRVSGGDGLPFQVSIDDEPWFEWNQGLRYRSKAGETFKHLLFRNRQSVELEIDIYVTNGEIDDARLNIVRDPNQLQIITQFPAPSYAVRRLPVSMAAAATLALPGLLTRGVWPCAPAAGWLYALPVGVNRSQRKSLRIEASADLNVLWWNGAAADVAAGVVLAHAPMPSTTVPFYEETSQAIVLQNPGAGAATIAILALFDVPVWFSLTSEDP